MNNNLKKAAMTVLAAVTAASAVTGCGKSTGSASAEKELSRDFTWTMEANDITNIEEIEFEDGPVFSYWLSKEWNVPGRDDAVKISIDVSVPPQGTDIYEATNNLLSTGEYSDIMNMACVVLTPMELYEQGTAIDLTDYIDQYMPNYKKWLDEHPELTKQLMNEIDGEPRMLELYKVADQSASPWSGFCYRRDWIVKYGTNPETGEAFTGGWNEDATAWSDDVVFPSGGADPVYISDWEWMFGIFEKALAEQDITDGYATQMFYKGYYEAGDLVSSFNAASRFYLDENGVYQFGGDDDAFRTYVSAMAGWYEKGWLEPGFDEDVSPAFFMLDMNNLYSGKVGLWYGMNSMLGKGMDNGTPLTEGICVYGCADPINDVYGDDSCRNKAPFMNLSTQGTQVQPGVIITDKALEKDLPALLTAFDYMYSDEGSLLGTWGLSDVQQAEVQNEFYNQHGLSDGAYHLEERDGDEWIVVNPAVYAEGELINAVRSQRSAYRRTYGNTDLSLDPITEAAYDSWTQYPDTGTILSMVEAQLSSEALEESTTMKVNLDTYMSQQIPAFITGKMDVNDDAAWQNYVDGLGDFDPETYCSRINEVLSR